MLRALTGAAVAASLLATPFASAEDVTLPGCYGVEDTVVCDPTITAGIPYGVEFYTETITVCASLCQDVDVRVARLTTTGEPLVVCLATYDRDGTPNTPTCTSVPPIPPVAPVADYYRDIAADAVGNARDALCELYEDQTPFGCAPVLRNTLTTVETALRP